MSSLMTASDVSFGAVYNEKAPAVTRARIIAAILVEMLYVTMEVKDHATINNDVMIRYVFSI